MLEINQTMQDIMEDVETGDAFDKSMLTKLDSMASEWENLATQENDLFGSFSPIKGMFAGLADDTPYSLQDLDELTLKDRTGAPITLSDSQKQQLLDQPKGILTNLRSQAESQFGSIMDNIKLYSSHQKVKNAMGQGSNCSEMADHFGSITEMGQRVADTVDLVKNTVDEFKMLKTQIQSEIDTFDNNVINILSGRINGTILSNITVS